MVVSVRSAWPSLWYCLVVLLDLGRFVLHVQRRHAPLGQHARAEPTGRAARDPTIEDQLHLIGPADVEILADDLFEEAAPGDGTIKDLGQRELGLQDRELIPIPGGAMGPGKRPVNGRGRRRNHLRTTASIFAASS